MSQDFAPTRRANRSKHLTTSDIAAENEITRRSFLGSMSAGACLSVGAALLPFKAQPASTRSLRSEGRQWLHAAVRGEREQSTIHTFLLSKDIARHAVVTSCPGIAALTQHPSLPVLYAACDMLPGQALPHGHIEAFAIDEHTGILRSIARVPMSLSATGPRSLAVSSDGTSLLVAASSGGLWNAFHLDVAGLPSAVAIARKEHGIGRNEASPSPARPHSIVYLPGQRLALATDIGSHQISILSAEQDHIAVHARHQTGPHCGPSNLALATGSQHLLVANVRTPALELWRLRHGSSAVNLQPIAAITLNTPVTALLALPAIPVAYTVRPHAAGSVFETWCISGTSRLELQAVATLPYVSATALIRTQGTLWAATAQGLLSLSLEYHHLKEASIPYPIRGLIALA